MTHLDMPESMRQNCITVSLARDSKRDEIPALAIDLEVAMHRIDNPPAAGKKQRPKLRFTVCARQM
jgi:hypothetical protein